MEVKSLLLIYNLNFKYGKETNIILIHKYLRRLKTGKFLFVQLIQVYLYFIVNSQILPHKTQSKSSKLLNAVLDHFKHYKVAIVLMVILILLILLLKVLYVK